MIINDRIKECLTFLVKFERLKLEIRAVSGWDDKMVVALADTIYSAAITTPYPNLDYILTGLEQVKQLAIEGHTYEQVMKYCKALPNGWLVRYSSWK